MNKKRKNLIKSAFKILKNRGIVYLTDSFIQFVMKEHINKFIKKYKIVSTVVMLDNGKLFALNGNDRGLSYDILINEKKMRENFISEYLLKTLKKEKLFLDIGANIGYYTLLLSDKFNKIIAIEPIKENVYFLKINKNINKLDKINIYNYAVGEKNGYVYMKDSEFKNLSMVSKNKNGIKTKSITLSTLYKKLNIKNNPDLIKMDVEGYEYNIIMGNKEFFIKNTPKKLFIEIHFDILNKKQSTELLLFLKKCGYRVERAFIDYPVIYYRLNGIIRKFYKNIIEHVYYHRKIGCIYKNVDIKKILNDNNMINGKIGAIEFLLTKR